MCFKKFPFPQANELSQFLFRTWALLISSITFENKSTKLGWKDNRGLFWIQVEFFMWKNILKMEDIESLIFSTVVTFQMEILLWGPNIEEFNGLN